jgi:FeS assembly SUF system protein
MTKFEQVADEDMVKNAVGEEYDEMAEPPEVELSDHPIARNAVEALRKVFDPEIPVNIYELGLIYKIDVTQTGDTDGKSDVYVEMTLTSPACPVAQEMPVWVQGAIFPLEGVRHVDVNIVWDPTWDPSKMAETAKLQLNMFV